jgi:hypothetical protein
MSKLVQTPESLKTSNVVFSELKKMGKGGSMMSFVNYNIDGKSQKLIIQTPKMFAPFGASTFKQDGKPDQMPKYDVQMSLDTKDKRIKALKEFLESLDELVCKHAASNKNWLKTLAYKNKKKKSKDEVAEDLEDNKYTSIYKEPRDEKYPGTFKAKIPIDYKTQKPATQLYSKNKQKLELTFDNIEQLLPKLSEIKGLIQISHVWFVSGKFGVVIKMLQALTYPKESLSGLSLLDDSDDEESEEEESEVEVESDSDDE